jgi:hypothetical protein
MSEIVLSIAIRLLICSAASYALWRFMGLVGVVVSAPLFGVLLAKPMLELAGELRDSARTLVYAEIRGRNFEHRGMRLDVVEDDDHRRWISLKDVQKLIPGLPKPAVLRAQFPDGIRDDPSISEPRIAAEALLQYLAKSTEASSLRFRNWLEREVVLPSVKVRERLQVKDQLPPA